MTDKTMTREEWLLTAANKLYPWLCEAGAEWPKKFRVSVGFPFGTRKAVGQCWSEVCSKDGTAEIFMSPTEEKAPEILSTLLHELIHACVGTKCGHKGRFIVVGKKLGFTKPWKSTPCNPELAEKIKRLAAELSEYPHATLTPATTRKKQSTRMLLVECPSCGCKARMTKKWLEDIGPPLCACAKVPMIAQAPEEED